MKLSMIFDKLTNVVLAACTRSAATANGADLGMLAGDELPVLGGDMTRVGAIPVVDLDLLDVDVTDPVAANAVLFAPKTYAVSISPASFNVATPVPATVALSKTALDVTLSTPADGKARVRITSADESEIFTTDADVKVANGTTLNITIAPALQGGSYGVVLLVTGTAAFTDTRSC